MPGHGHGPGARADVLLIEDEPGDALMVRESFAAAGTVNRFHVIPDGQRALRFLRRAGEYADAARSALILLDLNLPGLHGLDILAQIKADPALAIIPVIVLSASRDPRDITRAYARHANAYITKPADLDSYDEMARQIDSCFLSLITLPPPAPDRPGRPLRQGPPGTAGPQPGGVRPGTLRSVTEGGALPPRSAPGAPARHSRHMHGPGLRPGPMLPQPGRNRQTRRTPADHGCAHFPGSPRLLAALTGPPRPPGQSPASPAARSAAAGEPGRRNHEPCPAVDFRHRPFVERVAS